MVEDSKLQTGRETVHEKNHGIRDGKQKTRRTETEQRQGQGRTATQKNTHTLTKCKYPDLPE